MVVIGDTSPLNYLILIEADGVLPQLYGEVVVPRAVIGELRHADAPPAVVQWISQPPGWLKIVEVSASVDEALNELGAGERDAIIWPESTAPKPYC
jgi:predicted nucleic acid-binding protein